MYTYCTSYMSLYIFHVCVCMCVCVCVCVCVEDWNGGSDSEFSKPNIELFPKKGEIDLHNCLLLRLR